VASFAVLVSGVLGLLSVLLLVRPVPRPPDPQAGTAQRRRDPSATALHLTATAAAAAAALLLVPGAVGAAVAVAVAVVVGWRSRRWEGAAVRRRRSLLEADLPHVVDLMTAALAAGAAPTTALAAVTRVFDAPMSEELEGVCARLSLGADPTAVWSAMAGHPQLGRLGATLLRSAESGAPVAESLLRLSEDLRARQRAAVEERVRQVEVRAAVPLGVCLLPSFVLVGVVPLVAGSVSGLLLR
jgi:Flp pilus assembly protein TadB